MDSLINLNKPPATIYIYIAVLAFCQSNIHVKNIKHVEQVLAIKLKGFIKPDGKNS